MRFVRSLNCFKLYASSRQIILLVAARPCRGTASAAGLPLSRGSSLTARRARCAGMKVCLSAFRTDGGDKTHFRVMSELAVIAHVFGGRMEIIRRRQLQAGPIRSRSQVAAFCPLPRECADHHRPKHYAALFHGLFSKLANESRAVRAG